MHLVVILTVPLYALVGGACAGGDGEPARGPAEPAAAGAAGTTGSAGHHRRAGPWFGGTTGSAAPPARQGPAVPLERPARGARPVRAGTTGARATTRYGRQRAGGGRDRMPGHDRLGRRLGRGGKGRDRRSPGGGGGSAGRGGRAPEERRRGGEPAGAGSGPAERGAQQWPARRRAELAPAQEPAGSERRLRQGHDGDHRQEDDHEQRTAAHVHHRHSHQLRHEQAYRLFYTSHWIGSTSEAVREQNYYFLKPLANAANEPAIFVAPQAISGIRTAPGQQEGPRPLRRHPGLRQREPLHRHHARLRDRIQLRRHDHLLAVRESSEGHSRGRGHRAGQLQHLPAHQDPRTHRVDANDRHERRHVPMGQWEQHDPGREVHRHRARYGQRLHRAGDHPDLDSRATISATTSRVQTRSIPPRSARSTAATRTMHNESGTSTNWIPAESWKFFTQF